MKLLLDECLNWRLKRELMPHESFTVQDMGWEGKVNGELLSLASSNGFQAFITIDKRLQFQQTIKRYSLAVLVLDTPFNRLEYVRPLVPSVLTKLQEVVPGEVYTIS
ncbi:MAG: DUF5615 family PIN-like protein [Ignavibacteriae bacterium]|nr:DUF5615 family PIN-like protein [Ignavibacteriota bacterium]